MKTKKSYKKFLNGLVMAPLFSGMEVDVNDNGATIRCLDWDRELVTITLEGKTARRAVKEWIDEIPIDGGK